MPINDLFDRTQLIVNAIKYKDWGFKVSRDVNRTYIQPFFNVKCIDNEKEELMFGRKWFLSEFMTDSEIIQTVFLAVKVAEEHETRENFLLNDETIFGPHFDLQYMSGLIKGKTIKLEFREKK